MKHSLCFTSIVSNTQPSLSIPMKKSWDFWNRCNGERVSEAEGIAGSFESRLRSLSLCDLGSPEVESVVVQAEVVQTQPKTAKSGKPAFFTEARLGLP